MGVARFRMIVIVLKRPWSHILWLEGHSTNLALFSWLSEGCAQNPLNVLVKEDRIAVWIDQCKAGWTAGILICLAG